MESMSSVPVRQGVTVVGGGGTEDDNVTQEYIQSFQLVVPTGGQK